jgi:simple sugar transport system ATP-binding protein
MNLTAVTEGRVIFDGQDVTRISPAAHHEKGLSYVPADRRHIGALGDLPLHRNAILGRHRQFANRAGMMDERLISSFADKLIERFGIRPKARDYLAGKLSGGNLQKLILGREVMRDPRAIVVEQPTRGLDVGAIDVVWREIIAQRDAGKAILLISAELEEIFNLSDCIAVIYEGRIMGVVNTVDASMNEVGLMMAGEHRNASGDARCEA